MLEDYGAPLADEGKAYLQMVRDNTRQMGQLVDDLLAFSRLGRQALTKHTVDPDKIVRRCLEEMTKEQEGRQVEIVIGDLPFLPGRSDFAQASLDELAFERPQIHAQAGGRAHRDWLPHGAAIGGRRTADVADDAGPEVVYFVKDNGAGFDMKYAHKLFGVFQRLHRAADYEGTGVGLAIVQRIVQRHGGRVWGEAILNQGATFSFTLE